ncbi:MAG TPA: DUF2599 domain-containing protein [Actinomycetota bacterium]|nr:DUF2599 domain-containing protein [Actinomycetota bacterium]
MTRHTVRAAPAAGVATAPFLYNVRALAVRLGSTLTAALALSVVIALAGGPSAQAQPVTALTGLNQDVNLPPCAADNWIEGMALESYDNGDFKVVLTPTPNARTFGTVAVYNMWHVVQACVPGLYGALADSIYGQLACHADLSALPGLHGEPFATGSTWDFESWRPARDELASIASKCSSGWHGGDSYGQDHAEAGTWTVYFGVDPIEKSDQDIQALKAQRNEQHAPTSTYEQTVSVFNTGGVGLWTRSGPGFGADALQILPEDTQMTLLCQVHSELVVDWISTDLWDYVRLSDGQLVWVSDAFVYTGADGQVAPAC